MLAVEMLLGLIVHKTGLFFCSLMFFFFFFNISVRFFTEINTFFNIQFKSSGNAILFSVRLDIYSKGSGSMLRNASHFSPTLFALKVRSAIDSDKLTSV